MSERGGRQENGHAGLGESFVLEAVGSADTEEEEAERREKRKEKSEGNNRRGGEIREGRKGKKRHQLATFE